MNLKKSLILKLIFLICLIIAVALTYKEKEIDKFSQDSKKQVFKRIISMAPSTTEIIYAIGAGDKCVGVTDFCTYPEDVKSKVKVGGLINPHLENIVSLKPDLVLALPEYLKGKDVFKSLNLRVEILQNRSVEGILDSIIKVGDLLNLTENAKKLRESITKEMVLYDKKGKLTKPKKVLICLGRSAGSGIGNDIYIVGRNTLYDELLEHVGAVNAYTEVGANYPKISAEGIVRLNPDIIVELAAGTYANITAKEKRIADWSELKTVKAVKNTEVHILDQQYVMIPGPRFIKLLKDLYFIISG